MVAEDYPASELKYCGAWLINPSWAHTGHMPSSHSVKTFKLNKYMKRSVLGTSSSRGTSTLCLDEFIQRKRYDVAARAVALFSGVF